MGSDQVANRSTRARVSRWVAPAAAVVVLGLATAISGAAPAGAAPLDAAQVAAIDGPVNATDLIGDPAGVAVLQAPPGSFNGFPTQGDTALILSTGDATVVADPQKGALESVVGTDQIGTDLSGGGSADGNDLTQVRLALAPPADATCVAFDFLYLSEEYPNYVGQQYNDIFTAEIDESRFTLTGNQVAAPNNFALSEDEELLSVNTFTSFSDAQGSTLNGKSPVLSAIAPLREYTEEDNPLYLTVQDLGDSDLDSAVVIDNLRYSSGVDCESGVVSIVDTDGDALSDVWETQGIDYDGDGTPEVDLPAMGADPQRKDIFLELDWMYEAPTCASAASAQACGTNPKDMKPSPAAVATVVAAFADAPVSNPDGSTGIDLHVDGGRDYPMDGSTTWGDLSRANAVPYAQSLGSYDANYLYSWADFDAIKATEFEVARGDAFHYTLYADRLGACEPGSATNDCSSGISRGLPGGDLIVADSWGGFSLQQEAGTLMHELGHNLALTHAADRSGSPRYQQGYVSVMNYCYQMLGVGGVGSGVDYSRGTAQQVEAPCTNDQGNPAPKTQVAAVTYDDWANLVFDGGSIGDLGDGLAQPTETEIETFTLSEAEELSVRAAPGDGVVEVVGPDLFVAGVEDQVLIVEVDNPSAEETTYRVEIDDPWAAEPAEVTVAPYETGRVEVPVDVASVTEGPTPVTVSLYNDDVLVSESIRDLAAVDLLDEAVAADVQTVVDQVVADPEAFDAEASAQLQTVVESVSTGEVTPEPEDPDDGGFPIALVIGAAAVVVIAIVAVVVLRGRNRPSPS